MKLTAKREKFCQNIANGLSQYESYYDAFPSSRKWKRATVDNNAYKLMQKNEIKTRIEKLKEPQQNLLEKHRKELIEKAIRISLENEKVNSSSVQMLSKLLDKLLPTKTENKNENTDKTFEDFLMGMK